MDFIMYYIIIFKGYLGTACQAFSLDVLVPAATVPITPGAAARGGQIPESTLNCPPPTRAYKYHDHEPSVHSGMRQAKSD
jgi:hypothetical protein